MNGKNNVILIGFATSGKTTVGKLLAEKLNKSFVDLDESTYALYKKNGGSNAKWNENLFRQAENDVCRSVDVCNCVVACGGGTPMSSEFYNVSCQGTVVWLQVSAEQVFERLDNTARPLFDGLTLEQLKEFVKKRQPYYEFANFVVNTDDKSPEIVAEEICAFL